MCTVSWEWTHPELTIYFSRDERRTRQPGLPPEIFKDRAHSVLCPTDQDKGGTWFAANDQGVVFGLLNDYHSEQNVTSSERSRGLLVKDLAAETGRSDIFSQVEDTVSRHRYPPFTLLAWHQGEVNLWNYREGTLSLSSDATPPITSSSWETDRVETWRKEFYQQRVTHGNWNRERFHRHEIPGDEASSICMTRPDSRTVSLTICKVSANEVSMVYFPRNDRGEFEEGKTVSLPVNLLL